MKTCGECFEEFGATNRARRAEQELAIAKDTMILQAKNTGELKAYLHNANQELATLKELADNLLEAMRAEPNKNWWDIVGWTEHHMLRQAVPRKEV